MKLKQALLAGAASVLFAGGASAQISGDVVKLGILNDQSSLYADITGQGSVAAARMAVEDFGGTVNGKKIEIVFADHQNKPDVGSNVARQWYDRDGVDAIVDVPTSSVALAIAAVSKEKNKAFLNSGAASSDLTGKSCQTTTVHWTYDTIALSKGTGGAVVKAGGDSWYFLTADYAFGHALERDTGDVVKAAGGKVLGQSAIRSTRPTSRRSCSRPRRRRPRSSGSPMPAATPSTRSSRRRSSASSRAARSSPACSSSSTTSMRWACRRPRGCS